MEAIITVVGFLGAGKTTLLRYLTSYYVKSGWNPFIILNDYENADLDAQQFKEEIDTSWVKSLNGSCICCSGIGELRDFVNRIPPRENGITLIEANGTSDACSLMGFLGVGIDKRFLPPIQVSVVDVKNWQKRGELNDLEA
jgi:G3E family GTPase